ncbi:pyrimidine 5'-nucleotidase [Ideonella sp. BN130291]|uniref:pyrimidine 5'-nucleotidase n=1 Tax=Ideonella sp. BN130291 TaxID=3112940 RepID=UPI002E266403|nr:pyrimidine 5'-nucleotidase [Ideonella sp. BN130291]
MPAGRTVWLFDLDNTLHDASSSAFRLLDRSMSDYIQQTLAMTADEADRLRRHYWQRYGATLLGLVRHHGVKAPHFLDHTHRMPGLEGMLKGHPHDFAALRTLPGRKYILTNAPRAYTERVLRTLGIGHLFDGVITIEGMRMFGHWRPKPDTRMFRRLAAQLGVRPAQCVLVEDTLAHQKAARGLGFRTVWMQRWMKTNAHRPEVGVYLLRRPTYVCARITSLQQLRKRVRR